MPKVLPHVRDDICRTARQMLAEENYADFSIRNVAVRCGIGMGTIYNYFASKEDIVADILLADWDVILRRMDHANRVTASPLERLETHFGLLREFLAIFHGAWLRQGMMAIDQETLQKHRCRRNDYRAQLTERIVRAIRHSAPDGASDDPAWVHADQIARLFLSLAPETEYPFSRLAPAIAALIPLCGPDAAPGSA